MHKHAFKMGFSFKLAESRVCPSALADFLVQRKLARVNKLAKEEKDKKPKEEAEEAAQNPMQGFGAGGMTGVLKPVGIGLGGLLAASGAIPATVGRLGGSMLATGMANQMDTTDELRTRYLIKRYNDYIKERKAQLNNKLVGEALNG